MAFFRFSSNNTSYLLKMDTSEWCISTLIIVISFTSALQEYIKISTTDYLGRILGFQAGMIRPIQAFCQLFDVSLFRAFWWSSQFLENMDSSETPKIRFVEKSDTSLERDWETILNIQECMWVLVNVLFWHLMSHFWQKLQNQSATVS